MVSVEAKDRPCHESRALSRPEVYKSSHIHRFSLVLINPITMDSSCGAPPPLRPDLRPWQYENSNRLHPMQCSTTFSLVKSMSHPATSTNHPPCAFLVESITLSATSSSKIPHVVSHALFTSSMSPLYSSDSQSLGRSSFVVLPSSSVLVPAFSHTGLK